MKEVFFNVRLKYKNLKQSGAISSRNIFRNVWEFSTKRRIPRFLEVVSGFSSEPATERH